MSAILTLVGIIVFVVGMLASIALHELGHMYPAKKFGMKVTQYFVGFGRTVWSTKRGETEYGIKSIPLGGFVRIIGMMPPAKGEEDPTAPKRVRKANTGPFQSLIENARSAEFESVGAADNGRLFYQKVWWKKLIVMASGPMVNVVIAFILFGGLFMLHGVAVAQTTVQTVSECVIPASQASADRKCTSADKPSPAQQAGFKVGDKVLEFNGTPIKSWDELTPLIRANTDKPATIVVERAGQRVTLQTKTILNQVVEEAGSDKLVNVGFLGVSPEMRIERQDLGYTVVKMGDLTAQTFQALLNFPQKLVGVAQAIVGGERDQASPMSIVGASRVAGEVASTSDLQNSEKISLLVSLLASVNLFIALFNFIPLLPLDGGHMAGAIWEGIKRGFARLTGRPDPGYVDVAKLLPIAYVAATAMVVMGALLIVADVVNPIRLFNG